MIAHVRLCGICSIPVVIVGCRIGIGRTIHLVKRTITSIVEVRELELWLMQQVVLNHHILQSVVFSGRFKLIFSIIQRIVGNEMMLHVIDCHGHCFLEQTILFELVGIHQRADQPAV